MRLPAFGLLALALAAVAWWGLGGPLPPPFAGREPEPEAVRRAPTVTATRSRLGR
jgi:hypothetical protein